MCGVIPTRGLADSLGFPRAGESESMVANGRFAMRRGLTLRGDYYAARLRGVAWRTKSAAQGRRLLALSMTAARARRQPASAGSACRRFQRAWPRGARGPPGTGPSRQVDLLLLRFRCLARIGRIASG